MRKLIIILALLASSAHAAPAYLTCDLKDAVRHTPYSIELALDEEGQVATTTYKASGYAERTPAVFSQNEVRFTKVEHTGSVDTVVSRTTMDITRTRVIGDSSWPDGGKCRLQPKPKRAF